MSGADIALWVLSTACTALALWAIRISSTIHALRERVAALEQHARDVDRR
jgi:hypothetical protein